MLKSIAIIAVLSLIVYPGSAEDIVTKRGEKFSNVTITRTEPDGIMVMTSSGIIKIPFEDLNDDVQQKYHYRLNEARSYVTAEAERQKEIYEQTQAARKEANARNVALSVKATADVEASANRRAIGKFSLETHESGTNNTGIDTWRTDWGSYDRSITQNKKLFIAVHDVGGSSAICEIDVYFVAVSLTKNLHFIYDHRPLKLKVNQGVEANVVVDAPTDLRSRILHLAALGEDYAAGAQMEGWIVTGKISGQLFGMGTSNAAVIRKDAAKLIQEFEVREKEDRSTPERSAKGE